MDVRVGKSSESLADVLADVVCNARGIPADRVPCTHAFPRLLEFEVLDVPVAQLVCEGSDDLTRCARNYSLTQCVYVIALVHCGHGVRVAGVKLDARTGCSVARLSPRRLEVV